MLARPAHLISLWLHCTAFDFCVHVTSSFTWCSTLTPCVRESLILIMTVSCTRQRDVSVAFSLTHIHAVTMFLFRYEYMFLLWIQVGCPAMRWLVFLQIILPHKENSVHFYLTLVRSKVVNHQPILYDSTDRWRFPGHPLAITGTLEHFKGIHQLPEIRMWTNNAPSE